MLVAVKPEPPLFCGRRSFRRNIALSALRLPAPVPQPHAGIFRCTHAPEGHSILQGHYKDGSSRTDYARIWTWPFAAAVASGVAATLRQELEHNGVLPDEIPARWVDHAVEQYPAHMFFTRTVFALWVSQFLLRASETFFADSGSGWDPSPESLNNVGKTRVFAQKA